MKRTHTHTTLRNLYYITLAPRTSHRNKRKQKYMKKKKKKRCRKEQQEFRIVPGRRISFCWMRLWHYSYTVPYEISQLNVDVCGCVEWRQQRSRHSNCDTESQFSNQVSNEQQRSLIILKIPFHRIATTIAYSSGCSPISTTHSSHRKH